MKHVAKIQLEFLKKIARKWDDLSYDEQKAYLKRHPKSKRRITAKPSSGACSSPTHGQMFGSIDGGAPENFTNEQLSEALDKINEGRKNGNLEEIKKELPKGIIAELSYSRWKYVSPEHRKKEKTEKPDLSSLPSKSQRRALKAEKLMQKGNVVAIQSPEGKNYYKLDDQGRLWKSRYDTFAFGIADRQSLPEKIKKVEIVGPQLETIHKTDNMYFKTTTEVPAWINTGKTTPTGEYYGNSQFHKPVYEKKMLPEGTQIQLLHGGDFAIIDGQRKGVRFTDPQSDPGIFEKQYGYDATVRQVPLSGLAKTDENGKVISKPKKKNLPPIKKTEPKDDTQPVTAESINFFKFVKPIKANYKTGSPYGLITPSFVMKFKGGTNIYLPKNHDAFISFLNNKQPKTVAELRKLESLFAKAYKESKSGNTIRKWPEDEMTMSFKGLKRLFSSAYMHDDEPYVWKDNEGNIKSISIGFRDLGNWISRPGEEDDDYASWSENSEKKYFKMFKDWAKKQSWYNSRTMEPYVDTGEKSWAYFGIRRKEK